MRQLGASFCRFLLSWFAGFLLGDFNLLGNPAALLIDVGLWVPFFILHKLHQSSQAGLNERVATYHRKKLL